MQEVTISTSMNSNNTVV